MRDVQVAIHDDDKRDARWNTGKTNHMHKRMNIRLGAHDEIDQTARTRAEER